MTGAEPRMWGDSIVGFGYQPYATADGKERDWLAVGLSPRKAALTIQRLTYCGSNDDLLERLGRHTTDKGCLYVKRLDDIDREVLEELIVRSWDTNHVEPQARPTQVSAPSATAEREGSGGRRSNVDRRVMGAVWVPILLRATETARNG